jgi:hypothetical protein
MSVGPTSDHKQVPGDDYLARVEGLDQPFPEVVAQNRVAGYEVVEHQGADPCLGREATYPVSAVRPGSRG